MFDPSLYPNSLLLMWLFCDSYLRYQFYGTEYLGAAHGTAGILYILLQFPEWCREPAVQPWILSTLDHILSTQLVTGNFPVVDTGCYCTCIIYQQPTSLYYVLVDFAFQKTRITLPFYVLLSQNLHYSIQHCDNHSIFESWSS